MSVNSEPPVAVRNLTIEVRRGGRWLPAIREVSFEISAGERVALVGESGSGKSLTALALGNLLPRGARIADGEIRIAGIDVRAASRRALRELRGRTVSFVFQNPMSSLDPLVHIGSQIEETLEAHALGTRGERGQQAVALLDRVGVQDADRRVRDYAHQFSGGMQQRAMIASALAARPQLLVADEPTTALDVTVQAQILALIRSLSAEYGLSVLLITHDLAVARQLVDRVIVLYAGRVLEAGPTNVVVEQPDHPYTEALIRLVPDLADATSLPEPIPGTPLPGWEAGDGCPFAGRCAHEQPRSRELPWRLASVGIDHLSACVVPRAERR